MRDKEMKGTRRNGDGVTRRGTAPFSLPAIKKGLKYDLDPYRGKLTGRRRAEYQKRKIFHLKIE